MAWGSSWDKPIEAKFTDEEVEQLKQIWDKTILTRNGVNNNQLGKFVTEPKEYSEEAKALVNSKGYQDSLKEGMEAVKRAANKFPTHDPYTNPGAFLYYECDCGQVLNPKVKSFASLNNYASEAGWKIRWGSASYVPYCPKCVVEKGVE